MVFDIAITLFIIIGLIIGIFRNPIMSIIHTVLFVCFTFLFTPILGTFMPPILEMNNINLADLASSAANAISMVNNEIISFGENIGVKLLTIPSLYTTQFHYIMELHFQDTRCHLYNSMTIFS